MKRILLAMLIACAAGQAASADPVLKYSQPNYNKYHQGFLADHTGGQVLADDFTCDDPDPIGVVRWWGYYTGDLTVREDGTDPFEIYFHLSTGSHPTSLPADADPIAGYALYATRTFANDYVQVQAWVGTPPELQWVNWEPIYLFEAALPGGFDQWTFSRQSDIEGELWVDICRPGDAFGWCWLTEQELHLDYAAINNEIGPGAHDGPWRSLQHDVLTDPHYVDFAFELLTPEPATMTLLGLGLAGMVAARKRRR